MKKLIIVLFVFANQIAFSQITMTKIGTAVPIVNGDILASNQSGLAGEIGFKVKNTGNASTNVWVRCQDLINNDGSHFELCFGEECLDGVVIGNVYPSVGVILSPNGTTGNFDHFLNNNLGSGTFPLDFVFKFFQTNQATQGGVEEGNSIIVSYRYDPNLSTDEIAQLQTSGVIIKSTIVENDLVLDVLKNTSMIIFDLNGKVIVNTTLNYGMQTINFSDKTSGVYLVQFTNEEGKSSTKKIVKK